MGVYNKFAEVYDTMGSDRFSKVMVDYCRKLFPRHNIKPQTGLDLCCGTGTAVKLFREMGIEMSGLDRSKQMLKVARQKLGRQASFINQSLPSFRIKDNKGNLIKYDLVTSFYDSLNYMKNERALKSVFSSVRMHLNEDGYFVFDMNTPLSLKTLWDENVYAGEKDNMAWIWFNEYYPKQKKAACKAVFFKKKGRLWERFEETHYEWAYSNTAIKKLLKESGFKIKGFYNCLSFDPPVKPCYRICVVAQKDK